MPIPSLILQRIVFGTRASGMDFAAAVFVPGMMTTTLTGKAT